MTGTARPQWAYAALSAAGGAVIGAAVVGVVGALLAARHRRGDPAAEADQDAAEGSSATVASATPTAVDRGFVAPPK